MDITKSALLDLVSAQAADGELIRLIPAGKFYGLDGRGPFLVKDPNAVIAATQALCAAYGIDMVVDYNHQTDFGAVPGVGGTAPAAGWVNAASLEARPDGIYGKIDWTPTAQTSIEAKEFRYLSPVYRHKASGEVVCLLRLGLLNNPNLQQRAALASQQEFQSGENMEELLKKLAGMFGLPDDSDESKVVAYAKDMIAKCSAQAKAIATMAQAAGKKADDALDAIVISVSAAIQKPDASKFVPAELVTSLQAQVNSLLGKEAERIIDQAISVDHKITPAQREWAIAYCASDPEGFKKFLANQPAILGEGAGKRKPGDGAAGALDEDDLAVCASMGLSPDEYKKTKDKQEAK